MNLLKQSLAMLLVLCMLFSMAPITAFAEGTTDPAGTAAPSADQPAADEPAADEPTADEDAETTDSTEDPYGIDLADFEPADVTLSYADTYRILHLDCGRKYFTKDWIVALINEMSAAGYTHLELAFGNDGLRFLLDDMSVGTYTDDQVTAAIQAGNKAYYDFGTNELTQFEMSAIIAHANSKGIKIIPLLNNPGHMDAIVSAATTLTGRSAGYSGSSSTVDLENTAAVDFVKKLVEKYVAYFDGMGCNEFNFGADEYANDKYSTGSMGFGALTRAGKYQLFVDYVNEMAGMIKGYGMVPVAFNDGIYFNQDTSYNFDKQIMVDFWTSGWSGYQSASASTMAGLGHKMINVNGDYYYVLGKSDKWDSNGYTYASNWSNSAFMGSTVSNPAGSMFCIWCDYPNAETETQIAANTRLVLRAMAAEMQGKDANSISDEVISGGFNADGTIAETREWVTVPPVTESGVQVSGYELTHIEVTEVAETEMPAIEGAANVKAWDITPYVGTEKYTDKGDVRLPVPADWNPSLVKGFYVENGEAIIVEGTYADGFYTFRMPHFSVGGLLQRDANAPDKTIELNVGESKSDKIEGVDLTGQTFTPKPEGYATVSTDLYTVQGNKTLVQVESMDDIVSGGNYLITTPSGLILTAKPGSWNGNSSLLALEKGSVDVNNPNVWTITSSGTGYTVSSGADSYLTFDTNTAAVVATQTNIEIDYNDYGFTFQTNGDYLNNFGGAGVAVGGWNEYDYNADWFLYRIDGSEVSSGTTVTFTGVAAGESTVVINDIVYKIIVHGTLPITIKYVTEDGTVIKTETVTVADNATTYTLSNFNHVGKYYMVGNTTLTLTPGKTEYTVTVTEVAVNWDEVEDLTIEYFITNQRVPIDGVTSMELDGQTVYSEAGVDFAALVPASDNAENPKILWRGWLLPDGYHQRAEQGSRDMCTDDNGTRVYKIRYWDWNKANAWQYFDGTNWLKINDTDQIVAYYVQQTQVTDEVTTSVVDWGETYKSWYELNGGYHWFWSSYVEQGTSFVYLDFAVVYEDGTQVPNRFPQNDTWFFHFDGGVSRTLKPMTFTDTDDYEVWKVTVTDGLSESYRSATTFQTGYDYSTETVVWNEEIGGTPRIENLTYTENHSGKLVRIYIRAVAKEDSLKVVYYDEKFGNTLYSYNIGVKGEAGSETTPNFNDNIINSSGVVADPGYFGETTRLNVTGYGIVNALGKTQYFQTDLTQVPEAVGKYNSNLYSYAGSEIKDDGKTLYLYYTINQDVVYPNYVADFGLPIMFELSDIVSSGAETVTSVTVNEKTKYGTLSYENGTFLYKPTDVMQGMDILSINVTFDGGTTQISNVGVTPATTVYYEESFLKYDDKWGTIPALPSNPQRTEALDYKQNNYGYEPTYADDINGSNGTKVSTSTNGATASFTFTGTGFELFANCNDGTGYVTLTREGQTKKMYMMDTGLNYGKTEDGKDYADLMPGAEVNPTGTFYNIPIITERNLAYGTYTVTIRKTHNDGESLEVDGIRIFNTIQDSSIFVKDLEDNPAFFEMRDVVLTSIGSSGATSTQVYEALPTDASAVVTHGGLDYASSANAQEILNHSPKNEVYLHKDQTLTFKVITDRVVQIGLKAPNGATTYTINGGEEKDMNTSVDMFYDVLGKAAGRTEQTISVKNTGDHILAVTLLKICDDPNFSFAALTEADIAAILNEDTEPEVPTFTLVELKETDVIIDGTAFDYTGEAIEPAITVNVGGTQLVEGRDYSVTYTNNVEPGTATVTVRGITTASETLGYTGEVSIDFTINEPETPEEPEIPEETTKPTWPSKPGNNKPGKPSAPVKPGKPGNDKPSKPGSNKPGKPAQTQATAELKIALVDYSGKTLATAKLTAKGTSGETCYFEPQQILNAVKSKLPGKYAVVDDDSVTGVKTVYGADSTIKVQVGKVATLKVTYINLWGKKVSTVTITKVQTSGGPCVISASEIRQAAPKGYNAIRVTPSVAAYGKNTTIAVIVF